ncbi:MAG: GNAT family N-acetyltransferase [Pseudomonadota bacterium]
MTVALRQVGREAWDVLLPMMQGLQAYELTIEPNRLPPEEIGPHLKHLLDAAEREDGFVLLAEDDGGAALGFLIGVPLEESGDYVLPENRRYGLVTDLFTAPQARRKGVARALLAEAERRFAAKGLRRMEIGALAGNAPARALYAEVFGAESAVIYAKPLRRDPARR